MKFFLLNVFAVSVSAVLMDGDEEKTQRRRKRDIVREFLGARLGARRSNQSSQGAAQGAANVELVDRTKARIDAEIDDIIRSFRTDGYASKDQWDDYPEIGQLKRVCRSAYSEWDGRQSWQPGKQRYLKVLSDEEKKLRRALAEQLRKNEQLKTPSAGAADHPLAEIIKADAGAVVEGGGNTQHPPPPPTGQATVANDSPADNVYLPHDTAREDGFQNQDEVWNFLDFATRPFTPKRTRSPVGSGSYGMVFEAQRPIAQLDWNAQSPNRPIPTDAYVQCFIEVVHPRFLVWKHDMYSLKGYSDSQMEEEFNNLKDLEDQPLTSDFKMTTAGFTDPRPDDYEGTAKFIIYWYYEFKLDDIIHKEYY